VIPVWVVLGAALIMLCFYAVGTIGAIIQRSTWKTEQPRWPRPLAIAVLVTVR
jgi:hypothetical protein